MDEGLRERLEAELAQVCLKINELTEIALCLQGQIEDLDAESQIIPDEIS